MLNDDEHGRWLDDGGPPHAVEDVAEPPPEPKADSQAKPSSGPPLYPADALMVAFGVRMMDEFVRKIVEAHRVTIRRILWYVVTPAMTAFGFASFVAMVIGLGVIAERIGILSPIPSNHSVRGK